MAPNNSTIETISTEMENTKRIAASKRWCFTLNNYTKEEYDELLLLSKQGSNKFIITKEKTSDSGDDFNLMGYINFENKIRPSEMKYISKRIKWERCQGSERNNVEKYKTNDYETNMTIQKSKNETDPTNDEVVKILDDMINLVDQLKNMCPNEKFKIEYILASINEVKNSKKYYKLNLKNIYGNLIEIIESYHNCNPYNIKIINDICFKLNQMGEIGVKLNKENKFTKYKWLENFNLNPKYYYLANNFKNNSENEKKWNKYIHMSYDDLLKETEIINSNNQRVKAIKQKRNKNIRK